MLKSSPEGVILPIKVIPKAHRNEIVGWESGELKVRITTAPEGGNANAALLRLLAKHLGLSPSSLSLAYGARSRHKRVCIADLNVEEVLHRLPTLLP